MVKYGAGICRIDNLDPIESVVIHYIGNPYLYHNHLEITHLFENSIYYRNRGSKSLLIHGNNQIHIGFNQNLENKMELFKYVGRFKIAKVYINNEIGKFSTENMGFCDEIESEFDNMGKPEWYSKGFQNKLGVRKK